MWLGDWIKVVARSYCFYVLQPTVSSYHLRHIRRTINIYFRGKGGIEFYVQCGLKVYTWSYFKDPTSVTQIGFTTKLNQQYLNLLACILDVIIAKLVFEKNFILFEGFFWRVRSFQFPRCLLRTYLYYFYSKHTFIFGLPAFICPSQYK